ncbi:DUF6907 domain-containing protein [Streptomyces sp. JV180]|uniref:DUF6907 domain-containing protein n=1 Tax=Streptomyces sp. JV180 TaxID=858634 RepID=UPI00168B9E88|nr:hypothetical protein [Streptomyces sp. JV180]MBD3544463.1 hypothetical protein [Streptomyces sp. JV180]
MRAYTGPTLAGGTSTIKCPSWCVTDHAYWEDRADDCFHQSDLVEIAIPRDRVVPGRLAPAAMGATLRLHSTDPTPAAAIVWLNNTEWKADGTELSLAGVDQLLTAVDDYRAGLARLRGLLARIDAERR